jgi:hypothetical protein
MSTGASAFVPSWRADLTSTAQMRYVNVHIRVATCQMAYPNLGNFCGDLQLKMVVFFIAVWSTKCFVAIWYILWLFGMLFPFWYVVPRKIWQPLYIYVHRHRNRSSLNYVEGDCLKKRTITLAKQGKLIIVPADRLGCLLLGKQYFLVLIKGGSLAMSAGAKTMNFQLIWSSCMHNCISTSLDYVLRFIFVYP